MATERVFGGRRRVLLRKRISGAEVGAGLAVAACLAAAVLWVAAQGGEFNPADRDLPYQFLVERPVEDRLYRQPLKAWQPPEGLAGASGLAGVSSKVNLGAFPASILQGGWALSARPRSFDSKTLFQKINGEADKFLRLGFVALHYVAVKAPADGTELSIELFDQGSFAGALGAFSVHRGDDRPVERLGRAFFFRTPVGAIGFSGRYFFRMAASAESGRVHEKTTQLVRAFAALPGADAEAPFQFQVLSERMGVAPGDIAYQKQNVFQYDFAEDFWFGRARPGGAGRFFLHQAPNPAAAARLYREIAAEHRQEFQVLEHTESRVVMRHQFLKTHFAMRVEGRLIYGIENEPDAGRIGPLMRRYGQKLRHEG